MKNKNRFPSLIIGKCRGCRQNLPRINGKLDGRITWCVDCRENNIMHMQKRAVQRIIARSGSKCEDCGIAVNFKRCWKAQDNCANFHHIIPFAKGGSHHMNNIKLLCYACHKKVHKILNRLLVMDEQIKEKLAHFEDI